MCYEANYSCYGVRKMWKAINRDYADRFGNVARCTIERLMRQLGIDGVRRKRKRPKTASAKAEECPDDLVEREFAADGPNCLWVADITYEPQAVWVGVHDVHSGCVSPRDRGLASDEPHARIVSS